MINLKWMKILARKTDIQKAEQYILGVSLEFSKCFKTKSLKNHLYYYDGNTTHIFYDKKEFLEFQASLRERLSDEKFINENLEKFVPYFEDTLQQGIKLSKKHGDLLTIFDEWNSFWRIMYPYGWFFFFSTFLDELVEDKIKKIFPENYKEIMEIISKPPRLTPITSQEIDLMKLSLGKISPKQLVDKYSWMSVYNFEDKPRKEEYYIQEANKFKGQDVKDKIKEIEKDIENNEKEYKKIISKIDDVLLLAQTELLHRSGYIRDMREEVRDRLTMLERDFYEKLGKACNLSLEEIVFLTTEEIKESIKTKKSFKKEANERRKSYIFIGYNDKVKIVKDIDVKSLLNQDKTEQVLGKSAFVSDKVRGTARIVLNNSQIDKVKEGDILVAGMTKPDYMPAIKKAKALVTDEGGLTCHAAIVARELKKPCIIGTKIATLVFKDGDIVEVDSKNGIVKRINP